MSKFVNRFQSFLTVHWIYLWWAALLLFILEFLYYVITSHTVGIDGWRATHHSGYFITSLQIFLIIFKCSLPKPASIENWEVFGYQISSITVRKHERRSRTITTNPKWEKVIKWRILVLLLFDLSLSLYVGTMLFEGMVTPHQILKDEATFEFSGLQDNHNLYTYMAVLPPPLVEDACYDKSINRSKKLVYDVDVFEHSPSPDPEDDTVDIIPSCSFAIKGEEAEVLYVACAVEPGVSIVVFAVIHYTCIHDTLFEFKWEYKYRLFLRNKAAGHTRAPLGTLFGVSPQPRILTPRIPIQIEQLDRTPRAPIFHETYIHKQMKPYNVDVNHRISVTRCEFIYCADIYHLDQPKPETGAVICHVVSFISSFINIVFYVLVQTQILQQSKPSVSRRIISAAPSV